MPRGACPRSPETRARMAAASRRRWQAERAALAERLRPLADLTNAEAGVVLGRDPATIRSVRRHFGLPAPGRRPMTAEHRARISASVRATRVRRAAEREEASEQGATAAVAPVVRSETGRFPTEAQRRRVQERIERGEWVPRWSCSACGGQTRWPGCPPGWTGMPGHDLTCPPCRTRGGAR